MGGQPNSAGQPQSFAPRPPGMPQSMGLGQMPTLGGQMPPNLTPTMPQIPQVGGQIGHGQMLQQFLQNHPNLPPQAVAELQQMIARLQAGPQGAPTAPFATPPAPPISAPQMPFQPAPLIGAPQAPGVMPPFTTKLGQ